MFLGKLVCTTVSSCFSNSSPLRRRLGLGFKGWKGAGKAGVLVY
jgi:hypothetical protein